MGARAREGELLSAEFIERLRAGREVFFARRRRGDAQSRGFGQTPEFERNRPYEPGDDLRYVDWNLYARLERLLLKLYTAEEQGRVSVLVDASRSLREPPAKALLAARFAAAFSWLALASGRGLHLGAFGDSLLAVRGPLRSLQQFPAVLHFLAGLPEGGGTDLGGGIGEFLARWRGRHLVFVVSDLFQERPLTPVLDELLWRGVEPHLVQVVDDAELAPVLRGRCAVEDVEGGGTLRLSAGEDLLADLRRRIAAHLRDTDEACRRRSIPYLLARTSTHFERLFLGHLYGHGRAGQG